MAITHPNSTVTWSTASSITVASATTQISDAMTVDATCENVSITVSADNQGTPASGDTAIFQVYWSTDGTNFDTTEHGEKIAKLDTYATNTPGEDPARLTVFRPRKGQKFKIGVTCANAATRNILVAVTFEEDRIA